MFCNKCGNPIDNDAIFCNKCGERVKRDLKCQQCGKELEEDMVYCPSCGKNRTDSNKGGINQWISNVGMKAINKENIYDLVQKNLSAVIRIVEIIFSIILIVLCSKAVVSIPRYDSSYIYGEVTFGELRQLGASFGDTAIVLAALCGQSIILWEIIQIWNVIKKRDFSYVVIGLKGVEVVAMLAFAILVKGQMEMLSFTTNFVKIGGLILLLLLVNPETITGFVTKKLGERRDV